MSVKSVALGAGTALIAIAIVAVIWRPAQGQADPATARAHIQEGIAGCLHWGATGSSAKFPETWDRLDPGRNHAAFTVIAHTETTLFTTASEAEVDTDATSSGTALLRTCVVREGDPERTEPVLQHTPLGLPERWQRTQMLPDGAGKKVIEEWISANTDNLRPIPTETDRAELASRHIYCGESEPLLLTINADGFPQIDPPNPRAWTFHVINRFKNDQSICDN